MKRRIALGLLCLAALWPLVHRGLVARYDVNPWKLFGFAMYTTPVPPVQVVVLRRGPMGLEPVDEGALPETVRARLDRFRVERHALGRLRGPGDLAPVLLAALPEEPWLVLAVQRMVLDRSTASMGSERSQYVLEREATALPDTPPR